MTDPYETNPGHKIYGRSNSDKVRLSIDLPPMPNDCDGVADREIDINPRYTSGYIGADSAKLRISKALATERGITEDREHERKANGILTRTLGKLGARILGSDGPEEAAEQFRSDRDGLATLPGTIADKIRGRGKA